MLTPGFPLLVAVIRMCLTFNTKILFKGVDWKYRKKVFGQIYVKGLVG